MSKENAQKFLKLMSENPGIAKDGEKYDDGEGDISLIFSKLAKDKGLDCTAEELREVIDSAGELAESDLTNVAGGAKRDWYNAGIGAAMGILTTLQKSRDKNGKIHWGDPEMWMNAGMSGFISGMAGYNSGKENA